MEKAEPAAEPPSCLQPPIFMIGRDSKGHWVAQEKSGARGGLFINRAQALKFAKFESGDRPHAVVMISGILELDTSPATTRVEAARQAEIDRYQARAA